MNVEGIIADSHFAFINSQNNESLHLANEAIRLAPKILTLINVQEMRICFCDKITM